MFTGWFFFLVGHWYGAVSSGDGAGRVSVPGHPTKLVNWIIVGHGPIVLAVDAGVVWIFFSHFFLSLRGTVRYRLKYCLKRPFHRKATNQLQCDW